MKLPKTIDGKPVLDEATFQKLLAAAYVLQQHQERTRAAEEAARATQDPDPDYAHTLAEIVETQHQILMRRLDLDGAAGYVVEQAQRITSASGAAIGLIDRNHLVYRAVSGLAASDMGSALPKERAMSAAVLAQGTVLRCPNVRLESQIDQALVSHAGIMSFVAVPIFHDDQVSGVMELTFARVNGFTEYDVHTCQMMAGLVTEALARTEDERWKRDLAAERDSMLQALEKLKPQLDRLAKDAEFLSSSAVPDLLRGGTPAPRIETPSARPAIPRNEPAAETRRSSALAETECHKCGNHLGVQEVYCGSCGTLRSERPANDLRARAENANDRQAVFDTVSEDSSRPLSERMAKHAIDLPPEVMALMNDEPRNEPSPDIADELLKLLPAEDWEGQAALKPAAPAPTGYPWTSAAHARAWLNSMSDPKAGFQFADFMRRHRGDVSLVAAILLVLVAIFWSRTDHVTPQANSVVTTNANPSTPVTTTRTADADPDPEAQLSFWDRTLITLGLADAPVIPARQPATGNPEISVWLDLHTALYYCPGTELYGKTPKGRFAPQREAQSERFEPASGKVCE
jgi:GAF domain-containing protein